MRDSRGTASRYPCRVQRYFSTFPGGGPGAGLLLLRVVVGGAATIQGAAYLTQATEMNALTWIASMLAAVSGAALVAGFVTPVSGITAGLATLFIAATWAAPGASVFIDRLPAVFMIVDAAAVALLGPGAHSLDARLFGRREIIVPRDPLR